MNIKISRKEIQAISDGYEVCGLLYTHEAKCIVCLRDSPKEFHVCKLPSQGLEDLCGKSAVIIVEEASASSTSRHSKTKLVCPDCRHEVREILEYVNEIQVFRCDYCDYSKPIADWLHQSIRTGTAGEASASSSITESTNFCGKNYCGTCPQAMHGIPNKDPGTHRCTGHKCNI
ncbi:MAG: hypothetical protein Q8L72_00665, partial [Moraxellaceae bacterium]|nr:hypothetical protein [Moraxellaceae bacterium]